MLHRGGGIGHSIRVAPASANYVMPNLFKRVGYRPKQNEDTADNLEEEEFEDEQLERVDDSNMDEPEDYDELEMDDGLAI